MSLHDKLDTNPELLKANIIVADALDKLLQREWGSVSIDFTLQHGKITLIKVNDESTFRLQDKTN